jgi:hypothetical protein
MLEHTRRERGKTFPTSTSTRAADEQKIIGSEHSPEIKSAGSILYISLVNSHDALGAGEIWT